MSKNRKAETGEGKAPRAHRFVRSVIPGKAGEFCSVCYHAPHPGKLAGPRGETVEGLRVRRQACNVLSHGGGFRDVVYG